MAKFLYKMQSVLDVKTKLESQAKIEYTIASNKVREEEDKLRKFEKKKLDYEEQYRSNVQKVLDIFEINQLLRSIEIMKEKVKHQSVMLYVANKNLEVARKRLQIEMQERKTHEKLKEHAFEDFLVELNMAENKEIDELVSYQYGKISE